MTQAATVNNVQAAQAVVAGQQNALIAHAQQQQAAYAIVRIKNLKKNLN